MPNVEITTPSGTASRTTLNVNGAIPPLETLLSPPSTTIDVASRHSAVTRLYPGTRWSAPALAANSEVQQVHSGHAGFSVTGNSNFFGVQAGRFLAVVKGTIFDVTYDPAANATFEVSEGRVSVRRLAAILLVAENVTVEGIAFYDTIDAAGTRTVTYPSRAGVERRFNNANEAQQAFQQQLTAAANAGDPAQIQDAIGNLQRLSNALPPAPGTQQQSQNQTRQTQQTQTGAQTGSQVGTQTTGGTPGAAAGGGFPASAAAAAALAAGVAAEAATSGNGSKNLNSSTYPTQPQPSPSPSNSSGTVNLTGTRPPTFPSPPPLPPPPPPAHR